MTRANTTPSLPQPTVAARRPLIAALVGGFARVTSVWFTRRRTRTQLKHLDARMLDDIGVTWGQAHHEARRPFWHG